MAAPILGETIYLDFITNNSSGAATDADVTPTSEVFEDANDTPILTPTVTKRTSKTGDYRVPVACTTGNGFEVGKSYNVIALATVAGTAGKTVVASFQVRSTTIDGPSSVTLTFHDSLAATVPLVRFTIVGQASGTANTSGVAAFGLLDGSYTVVSAPTNGVFFANTTLTVSGTTALTITGTSPTITPPSNPDLSLVYGDLTDLSGNPAAGVKVIFTLVSEGPAIDGGILQQAPPEVATTDSGGHFEINLTKTSAMTPTGLQYQVEINKFRMKQKFSLTGGSFDIGTLIT